MFVLPGWPSTKSFKISLQCRLIAINAISQYLRGHFVKKRGELLVFKLGISLVAWQYFTSQRQRMISERPIIFFFSDLCIINESLMSDPLRQCIELVYQSFPNKYATRRIT